MVYGKEHGIKTSRPRDVGYRVGNLLKFWSGKKVSDITAKACRAYAETKTSGGARRDLEILRAAVRYWHREYGPLDAVPIVVLPDKGGPRVRWLTKSEAARLLWAARRFEHLKRFIILGLHTGSRAGVLFNLQWDWIDTNAGILYRKAPSEVERKTKRRPTIPIGPKLAGFVRRWRAKDGAGRFVVHWHGAKIESVRRSWGDACEEAGLPGVTPHVMRHTCATWLMQAGTDMWKAAGFLGMTVEVLQNVYGHHHPGHMKGLDDV